MTPLMLDLDAIRRAPPDLRGRVLVEAARAGDLARVQAAAAHGCGVLTGRGREAMAAACGEGHLDIVQFLYSQGVAIDFSYTNVEVVNPPTIQHYPLRCALSQERWRLVEWLYAQGLTPVHQQNALTNLVSGEPGLLKQHLAALPYAAAWSSRSGLEKKDERYWMAQEVGVAMEVAASEDGHEAALILLDAGILPGDFYETAMQWDSLQILQHLYVSGYRPPDEQLARHHSFIGEREEPSAATHAVRNLLRVWALPPEVLALSEEDRKKCIQALAGGAEAAAPVFDMPAAVVLTRAGYFMTDVAPLAARDARILQAACRYGRSVADLAQARGELQAVFAPQLWTGRAAEMEKTWQGLPGSVRDGIDDGLLKAGLRQHQMRINNGAGKFRLGGRR